MESGSARRREKHRGWGLSVGLGALVTGAAVGLSAIVNPLFGRYVHWDWMVFLAPSVFLLTVLSLRRRWV